VVIEESNGGDDSDPGMLLSSRDLSHTSILYMIDVGCVYFICVSNIYRK
jgi:hypothetical protein